MYGSVKIDGKQALTGRNVLASAMTVACTTGAVLSGAVAFLTNSLGDDDESSLWLRLLVSLIVSLVTVSLLIPFKLGCEAWFCIGAAGIKPTMLNVLYWCMPKHVGVCVHLWLSLKARKLCWLLAYTLPGIALLGCSAFAVVFFGIQEPLLFIFISGGSVTLLIGLLFYFITVQRYFLVSSIIARYPDVTVGDAVRESLRLMEGNCLKATLFKFSFAPWLLLCVAVLPASLYVLPYYRQSCSCLKLRLADNKANVDSETEK